MANEYLKRTPTSTGNRKVFTWAGWVKLNVNNTTWLFAATPVKDNVTLMYINSSGQIYFFDRQGSDPTTEQIRWNPRFRDLSSWKHIIINADTTKSSADDRVKCYVNGVMLERDETASLLNNTVNVDTPAQNQDFWRLNGSGYVHYIGARLDNTLETQNKNQFTDIFYVDGQQLGPDIFGFYKDGKGYISAGTSQSTDFRPGQWVPKSPRIIKSEINRRGGFGVNGFYLPMNSSNNFGADFHTAPDTILRLKEALPQPKAEIDGSGDYTNALRDDPFKQYLVLAIPFVSGGLQNGFGDYSAAIRGSGSPKTITNSNTSITTVPSYYGSAAFFNGTSGILTTPNNSDFYFNGQFTIECWVNWNGTSTYYQNFIGCNKQSLPFNNNAAFFRVWGTSAPDSTIRSRIGIGNPTYDGSGSTFSGVALPTNQLIHVSATRDSSNTTRVFMNGVCVGIKTNDTSIYDFSLEGTAIGQGPWDGAQGYYSGYLQDLRVYKGIAKYTSGFDVPKPYTPVGIATWRAVPDTTANNFATLNPLRLSFNGTTLNGRTLTNGNLTVTNTSINQGSSASISVSSGQWYWEFRLDTFQSDNIWMGILDENFGGGSSTPQPVDSNQWPVSGNDELIMYGSSGSVYRGSVNTTTSLGTIRGGDILGFALDLSTSNIAPTVSFYKNGVLQHTSTGSITTVATPSGVWRPAITFGGGATGWIVNANFGQNPTFSGTTTAGTFTDSNGKGLFKYQPPAGFLALCEDNLPTPAIKDPGEHFKTVLYSGSSSERSITGLGFKPDLVWIKDRDRGTSTYYHALYDSIRGSNRLSSNLTSAEADDSLNGLKSFDDDGFSIGIRDQINGSSNFVAWCWKAGGPAVTNTDGSITSQVSANQDAGFSIVSYTGTGANATIGHGLGKTPKLIIVKNRDSVTEWPVLETMVNGGTYYLRLDQNYASTITSIVWNNTNPTSDVFSVGTYSYANENNSDHIAYCWAEIEGYSKFGSYVGNGSADGPFVYCGFKPAWVMIRAVNSLADWVIMDSSRSSTNPNRRLLYANLSNIEGDGIDDRDPDLIVDFLSNGFKCRATNNDLNNAETYIFAAFAESPFTTANAK